MRKQLELGYVRIVPDAERDDPLAHYITHFPVLNDKKDEPRPVFNCAAKSGEPRKSINDAIHPGPKLMNDLLTIIIRHRRFKISLMGDIKHMFLRISLAPEDRKYHRFFWINEENIREEMEWQVHPFGNAGSPCAAIFGLKTWAEKKIEVCPRATEMILESTLMDDAIDSFKTEEEAIQVREALTKIAGSADMQFCKFASNSQNVIMTIPKELRAKGFDLVEDVADQLPFTKVLGLIFDSQEDKYRFQYIPSSPEELELAYTMRKILRSYSRIFDPSGWLAPHILLAKLIFQRTYNKSNWDKFVPRPGADPAKLFGPRLLLN